MVGLRSPSTIGVVELEGPEEVGGLLEVGADSGDLMDKVLNTDDACARKQVSRQCNLA